MFAEDLTESWTVKDENIREHPLLARAGNSTSNLQSKSKPLSFRDAVICIAVVQFHLRRGAELEYVYPPIEELESVLGLASSHFPSECRTDEFVIPANEDAKPIDAKMVLETFLPCVSLPDRHEAFKEAEEAGPDGGRSVLYFSLPPFGPEQYQGVSCFHQVDDDEGLDISPEVPLREPSNSSETAMKRGKIQKAVVLLYRVPFHGFLESRLRAVAHAFCSSKEKDNSDRINLLHSLFHSLNDTNFDVFTEAQLSLNLPVTEIVRSLGTQLAIIFRLLLLNGRILLYASTPQTSSQAVLSIVSLIPGLLALTSNTYVSSGLAVKRFRMEQLGMPLQIFGKSCVCVPNLVVQHVEYLLSEPEVEGFFAGTCNPLLVMLPSSRLDAVIDMDTGKVMLMNTPKTEASRHCGAETEEFFGFIYQTAIKSASEEGHEWDGSDAWIRSQIQVYFEQFLKDSATAMQDQLPNDTTEVAPQADKNSSPRAEKRESWLSWMLGGIGSPSMSLSDHEAVHHYGRDWFALWMETESFKCWAAFQRQNATDIAQAVIREPSEPPESGHSSFTYPNGDKYIGDFSEGKRHGHGTYVEYATGNQYDGEWLEDERSGHGTMTSGNKEFIYEGSWIHDKRTGKGRCTIRHKESYTGNWLDNRFHGIGSYVDHDGSAYEGEWKHGIKDGVGKLSKASGETYTGEYMNGKPHGTGTWVYADGSKYSGIWNNGKRHGDGVLQMANADIYEGQFADDRRHGMGVLKTSNGDVKEGQWVRGQPSDGEWTIKYANNGDIYNGQARNGRPWGYGVMKFRSQAVYSGSWKDGLRHGEGLLIFPSGETLAGVFEGNQLVSQSDPESVFIPVQEQRSKSKSAPLTEVALLDEGDFHGEELREDLNTGRTKSVVQAIFREEELKADLSFPSEFQNQRGYIPQESGLFTLVYSNQDVYTGEFKHHLPNGIGKFTEFRTKNVYEGEWELGKRHGKGTLISGMKDFFYEGEWADDMRSGEGTCAISNRESYTGQWQKNVFHGRGEYLDSDGNIYKGEFHRGLRHGVGRWTGKSNNEAYSGEFQFGERQGVGTCTYADGSVYSGGWMNSQRCGEGTHKSASGDIYEGQWLNDWKHGCGTLRTANGDNFEGQWLRDSPAEGEWTVRYGNGNIYTGTGITPNGYGVMKYHNKDVYSGEWTHGKRQGHGICVFANGESFEGDWDNDHIALNGKGRLVLADGTVHDFS